MCTKLRLSGGSVTQQRLVTRIMNHPDSPNYSNLNTAINIPAGTPNPISYQEIANLINQQLQNRGVVNVQPNDLYISW